MMKLGILRSAADWFEDFFMSQGAIDQESIQLLSEAWTLWTEFIRHQHNCTNL